MEYVILPTPWEDTPKGPAFIDLSIFDVYALVYSVIVSQ